MRKIDFYLQVILLAIIAALALGFYVSKSSIFFSLIGLFILGVWQIISALVLTFSHHSKLHNKFIRYYWIACISTLIIFIGTFGIAKLYDNTLINWFIGTAITGGIGTAFYYLYIYKKYFLAPANRDIIETIPDDGSLLADLEITK